MLHRYKKSSLSLWVNHSCPLQVEYDCSCEGFNKRLDSVGVSYRKVFRYASRLSGASHGNDLLKMTEHFLNHYFAIY